MRKARQKRTGEATYFHCYSRIAGRPEELPFEDTDKAKGYRLLVDLSSYYLVDVVSAVWMGNHFHVICHAPAAHPDVKVVAERHNAFWAKKNEGVPPSMRKPLLDPERDPEACEQAGRNMIDISHFMGVLLQRYTRYYNRVHKRRGTLWADRFKSTVLEGNQAVWNCMKYVELNPVRAGMVDDPADYRFCTWGWFNGGGKFLFGKRIFLKHLRNVMTWCDPSQFTDDELIVEFRGDLARTMVQERQEWEEKVASKRSPSPRVDREAQEQEVSEAVAKAKKGDSMPVRFLRRTRHWVDGGIIGSKAFVREVACEAHDRERVLKKQLSRGETALGALYCFKRLREAVE